MAFLKIVSGTRAGEQINLDQPVLRIGRREENNLVLSDPSVSGAHCEIEKSATGYTLRDLGSTNGTRINGNIVSAFTPEELKHNDMITLGKLKIQIYIKTT